MKPPMNPRERGPRNHNINNGRNHNCWDYHEGKSAVRMGKALRDGYRDKVFLMTKIDGRSKTGAAAQIDESLRRLQTDHVDLLQFHEIIRMDGTNDSRPNNSTIRRLRIQNS